MDIVLRRAPAAEEGWRLEEMNECTEENLEEIEDQKRQASFLMRVDKMATSEDAGGGLIAEHPPSYNDGTGDEELDEQVRPKPILGESS